MRIRISTKQLRLAFTIFTLANVTTEVTPMTYGGMHYVAALYISVGVFGRYFGSLTDRLTPLCWRTLAQCHVDTR